MRGSQPSNRLGAAPAGSPGRGPRFLHLLVGRHETDVVDHRAVPHREDQKVLRRAGPHLPAVHRPIRQALARRPALDTRSCRERSASRAARRAPQRGVDAVGRHHNIGLGSGAVGERDARCGARLARSRRRDGRCGRCPSGRFGGEQIDEVGTVHAEGGVPAGRIGHLHRRDRRAVVAEVVRARRRRARPIARRQRPRPTRSRWRTAFGVTNTPAPTSPSAGRLLVNRNAEVPARSAHWRRTSHRCRRRR